MTLRTIWALAGLGIGAGALLLQAAITFSLRLAAGHDLLDAVIFFFTYFTILTNLMLVLIYLSELVRWPVLDWWRRPVTRGMMTGAIILVAVFYHVLLAGLWAPQGWAKLADIALHYVTPILYVVWWAAFQPKGQLRFGDIPMMLLPIFVWLAWAMLRGAVVGEYPYPILEADKLGYGAVALNCLVVLIALIVLFGLVILADRALGRRRQA
ncbi:MAG: Pr6Pr family membrane protein [Alphaproteobacteria bacterium]|nr:Pr6Pr family membrane protein [Alphaproteobacteria bacterium]